MVQFYDRAAALGTDGDAVRAILAKDNPFGSETFAALGRLTPDAAEIVKDWQKWEFHREEAGCGMI